MTRGATGPPQAGGLPLHPHPPGTPATRAQPHRHPGGMPLPDKRLDQQQLRHRTGHLGRQVMDQIEVDGRGEEPHPVQRGRQRLAQQVVPQAVLHHVVGAESVDGHAHRGRRGGLGVDPKLKGEPL